MPVGVVFEWVLYHSVLCLLVAGYLEIKLKKDQVPPTSAFTEETCLVQLSTHFGKCIPTTAYQIFLFVPDSIKPGRACSSNVYSVLRTKSEIILMTVHAIHVDC